MFGIKGPSLLIRITHLIFIHIIFIFSALALVFFYPENDKSPEQQYSHQADKIETASEHIFHILKPISNFTEVPYKTETEIKAFIEGTDYISNVALALRDTLTGKTDIVQLAQSDKDDYYGSSATPANDEEKIAASYFKGGYESFLAIMTEDGKYTNYFVRAPENKSNSVLILRSPNRIILTPQNEQAYLLLLLFLISALISLLIIYLITNGIKRPLAQLSEGFAKTAEGHQFYIEETGDKQIRMLSRAFNEMSRKLTQKQGELARANSDLMKSNQNLVESESILTKLVDYSPDAIIVTDPEDHVIIYNQAAAREFGYDQRNMTGKKMGNFISASNDYKPKNFYENGNGAMKEIICRRKDGTNFPALLVQTPLGTERNRPMAILYFIRSISESENYQAMILKLDRIATRGKMARDVAHEINNYLAILQGNLELIPMILAKGDGDMEKVEQKFNLMKETVSRISNFTDGLTRFSDENSEFEKEDLNQLIENLIAFLKPQNKFDNITITTNLSENIPLVEIDSSQIQHLLVNLVNNGAEALAESGDDKWIVISTSFDADNQELAIKIADSGAGIKDELVERLFVNRFSTKRHGNGLGLITCKNIVDNHNGEISYHASEESKSVFTVKIPIVHTVKEPDDKIEVQSSKLITS
jgi:PAS domain S-box-containing protein